MVKRITTIDQNLQISTRWDLRKLFIISVLLNVVLIAVVSFREIKVLHHHTNQQVIVERLVDDIPLTDSAILGELVKLHCVLPAVALAQMKLETGHFKSNICKENKNIAGIKTSRSEYVLGMKNGHCAYSSYRDCLRDYIRIQNRYLKNIDGKYAESDDYIKMLKNIQ